jgi:hypothetical protein
MSTHIDRDTPEPMSPEEAFKSLAELIDKMEQLPSMAGAKNGVKKFPDGSRLYLNLTAPPGSYYTNNPANDPDAFIVIRDQDSSGKDRGRWEIKPDGLEAIKIAPEIQIGINPVETGASIMLTGPKLRSHTEAVLRWVQTNIGNQAYVAPPITVIPRS